MTPKPEEKRTLKTHAIPSFKEKILIFEPHPDDVAYQIAGSVAKWITAGKEVMICTVTNGNNSTFDKNVTAPEIERIMMEEHKKAMEILGVDSNHHVQWHYNDLDLDPGRDRIPLLKDMIQLIRKFKPTTVVTMDPKNMENEENGDHRMVALTGFEAAAISAYPNVYREQFNGSEVDQHFVARLLFYMSPCPNVFNDINGEPLETKIKLGNIYQSQLTLMLSEIKQRLHSLGLEPDLDEIPQEEIWKMVCESGAEEMASEGNLYYKSHPELMPRIKLEYAEAFRMFYLGVVEKLSRYLPKEWLIL